MLASVVNNPSLFDPSSTSANRPGCSTATATSSHSMAADRRHHPGAGGQVRQKLPKFPNVPVNERYGGPKGFLLKMVEQELAAAGFDLPRSAAAA